jgi:hypothetical protein
VHYRINGRVIRTERTAKPRAQASSVLKQWLLEQPCRGQVLDFGCGRLRYAPELATVATSLTFVDSAQQLSRRCRFENEPETVAEYAARRWPTARILEYRAFMTDCSQYDFILCANVLSAIPLETERRKIVQLLASRLTAPGQCLFVTQYRNSYYRALERHPGASPHLDGLLVDRGGACTFYGLLRKEKVTGLIQSCGSAVERAWIQGQSAYVLCSGENGISAPVHHHRRDEAGTRAGDS